MKKMKRKDNTRQYNWTNPHGKEVAITSSSTRGSWSVHIKKDDGKFVCISSWCDSKVEAKRLADESIGHTYSAWIDKSDDCAIEVSVESLKEGQQFKTKEQAKWDAGQAFIAKQQELIEAVRKNIPEASEVAGSYNS